MSIGKEFAMLFSVLFLPGLLGQFATVPGGQFDDLFYQLQILVVALPQLWLIVQLPELNIPGSQAKMGFRAPVVSDATHGALVAVVLFGVALGVGAALRLLGIQQSAGGGWHFTRPALVPLLLLSTLAIGYREEAFYRAYLCTRAEELGAHPWMTIGGSALLFGVGHLYQGVIGLLTTTAMGVVLAAIFLRRRNFHALAIGHGLYNAAVLLFSGGL